MVRKLNKKGKVLNKKKKVKMQTIENNERNG